MHWTTDKDVDKIRQLNAEGKNDREIAEAIGSTAQTVCKWRKYEGIKPNRAHAASLLKRYAALNADGETLATGTVRELAQALGKSETNIRSLVGKTREGRARKLRFYELERDKE